MEQTVDSAPGLQILDALVPQMEDQLADVLKTIYISLPIFAEQVFEVPKINLQDTLVEVPTVVPLFQQHLVEQNVDITVLGPRGVLDARGLHGFPTAQGSTALHGTTSPGMTAAAPGQGSTAPRGRRFAGQVFMVPAAAGRDGSIESLTA